MCPSCNTEKDESEFYKCNKTKDHLSAYCKKCQKEKIRSSRLKNRNLQLATSFKLREPTEDETVDAAGLNHYLQYVFTQITQGNVAKVTVEALCKMSDALLKSYDDSKYASDVKAARAEIKKIKEGV